MGARDRAPSRTRSARLAVSAALVLMTAAPTGAIADEHEAAAPRPAPTPGSTDTLRGVAPSGFFIGSAAAGGGHHVEMDYPDPFTSDATYRAHLAVEFNSVTPENQLKWEFVHPEPEEYRFGPADAIVEFAEEHDQGVRGHTLLWHSQNPAWLEEGDFTDAELREILREHITTVVGRYAGRIQQWDVANEIFDGEGEYRLEENIWLRELGPEIIADAFRWAHEADPEAQLFFNDWGVESVNAKSTAYYELIQDLLADDVPVHGFSVQGHLDIQYGFPDDLESNLQRFDDLGMATAITEIDVRMTLGEDGATDEQLARQAEDYRRAIEACLNVDGCASVTIWGFTDTYSWVPEFFEGQGGATVMWEDYTRKPAYHALHAELVDALPDFTETDGLTHEAHIRVLARDGVLAGHTDGSFAAGATATRGQFAIALARLAGLDTQGREASFSDTAGRASEGAIAALAEAEIVAGYPDGTFGPGEAIRRDQAAVLVARWLELAPADDGPFTDVSGVHAGLIHALHDAGVVYGSSATTFSPGEEVRRDQMAALLSRARFPDGG